MKSSQQLRCPKVKGWWCRFPDSWHGGLASPGFRVSWTMWVGSSSRRRTRGSCYIWFSRGQAVTNPIFVGRTSDHMGRFSLWWTDWWSTLNDLLCFELRRESGWRRDRKKAKPKGDKAWSFFFERKRAHQFTMTGQRVLGTTDDLTESFCLILARRAFSGLLGSWLWPCHLLLGENHGRAPFIHYFMQNAVTFKCWINVATLLQRCCSR